MARDARRDLFFSVLSTPFFVLDLGTLTILPDAPLFLTQWKVSRSGSFTRRNDARLTTLQLPLASVSVAGIAVFANGLDVYF